MAQIKDFDAFFIKHRPKLRTMAQQICYGHESFEDILQDNYIKIRNRVQDTSGFTITKYSSLERSFTAYFYRAIKNDYLLLKKRESRRPMLEISEPKVTELADYAMIDAHHDKQNYYAQTETIVRYLFRFVAIRYNERHQFLWKSYYLNPDTKSYKQLAITTGYETKTITNVIRAIKADIKLNFVPWLKYELQAKGSNYISENDIYD